MKLSVVLSIVFAVGLAGASLAAKAADQTLGVSYAAASNQNRGGSSIEVTRTFNNGVSVGAFLDRVKDREAGGLHLQSPKTEVMKLIDTVPVMGRIGLGVAKSSSQWSTQVEQQQTNAGNFAGPPVADVTSGVEKKWTPFLSGELSHDFTNGFEAFVGGKHFFKFADHSDPTGKAQTFVNAGLRFTF